MHYIHFASQIISHLRNNCQHRTKSSWVTWRDVVERIYEFDVDVSKIKYYINHSKGVSSKIKSNQDAVDLLKNNDRTSVLETIKLVDLYLEIEKLKKEQLAHELNKKNWLKIRNEFALSDEENNVINNQISEWISAFQENKFHIELLIPTSLLLISLDYFLRWIALWSITSGKLSNFFGEDIEEGVLYILNIVIICPVIILFGVFRNRWIEKKSSKIFKDLGIKKIKLKTENTPWNYMLLAFYAFSGIFIMSSTSADETLLWVYIFVGIVYGIYLLLILRLFSKRIPQPQFVLSQLEKNEQKGIKHELTSEENDEEIVDMEVGLRSANERMEAFVLEAALFGALAFSGFLQMISSGFVSIENMEKFTGAIIALLDSLVHFNFEGTESLFAFLMSKEGLISLMCYEALFCSVFFLAVIASRLRFNDLTDSVDKALRLSESYNKKEEDLIRNQKLDETNSLVKRFNKKIREQLRLGYLSQLQIDPIMEYMKFFRTLGVTAFFIIIITGGLFISVHLSLLLIFISTVSMFYFRLNKLNMFFKTIGIGIQEFYFRAEKYVHLVSWSMIIFALLIRTFLRLEIGGPIMFFGFTILFLHYLFSLFLPAELHEDAKQKNEGIKFSSIDFPSFLQKNFKIGLALFFLGFMFKIMHWPGSGPLLIVGLLMLSFFFFSIKKLPNGPKWLDILLSLSLGTAFIGLLFKRMHWPGASYFVYTFTFLMPILTILVFYLRKNVRPFLQRTVYILTFFSLAMWYKPFAIGVWTLNFNPTAIENTQAIDKIFNKLHDFYDIATSKKLETKAQKDSIQTELNLFTESFMKSDFADWDMLNRFAWEVYENINDTMLLEESVKWAKRSVEINKNYMNLDTYTCLLYKLGKYEEAEKAAIEAIEFGNTNGDNVKETKQILGKIQTELLKQIPDSLQTDSVSSVISENK